MSLSFTAWIRILERLVTGFAYRQICSAQQVLKPGMLTYKYMLEWRYKTRAPRDSNKMFHFLVRLRVPPAILLLSTTGVFQSRSLNYTAPVLFMKTV